MKIILVCLLVIIIIFIIIIAVTCHKDKYITKPKIYNTLSHSQNQSKPNILSCLGTKIKAGANLQSSTAWCLLEFLTGTTIPTKPYVPSPAWNNSPFGKIILKLPNTFILKNIATITLATCPDPKTGQVRETCAFTGDQCPCGWIGGDCQTPPQNACPRNPHQECSCGGWAVIQALLNDITNVTHLKVDSIDNVSIPNLLDKDGVLELSTTLSIPDLFVEGGEASAKAMGYFCPSPNIEVGASVKGLGCTVSAIIQLSIKAKVNQDGSYITLTNSSVDFTIKGYKVYNGVGWVFIDILGLQIPFGIEMGGVIINVLSATNVFSPWFGTIINSLKGQLLGPINTALGNIKIPIGGDNNENTYEINPIKYKTNILQFKKNNQQYYRYFHNDMINTNFNHTLGTHHDTLKMYSTGIKCQFLKDVAIIALINKLGGKTGIFSKLKPSYDLSNVKTKSLIAPSSETDKLGTVSSIKRSGSSYAYSIALGLINFNFNFAANLTELTGINLTTITIPKNGICITKDKTISLTLDNKTNNLAIGCNIESGGNVYIPYTTESITIDAKPTVNSTFTLEMKLVGKLDEKNILILDESQCTMTFSDVKISLKTNLTMTSSEPYFEPIFTAISLDINTLVAQKLSPMVSDLVKNNFGNIITPIIVKLINDAKIPLPL